MTDGPFGGLEIPYVGKEYHPHCLSRQFETPENVTNLAQDIRPASIEKLFLETRYEPFNIKLERTAHNSIPHIIRGDFLIFTAPFGKIALIFVEYAKINVIKPHRSGVFSTSYAARPYLVEMATSRPKEEMEDV